MKDIYTDYYAMITPGRASDWGSVVLIDARIGSFIEAALSNWDDDIEEFKKLFSEETWKFIRNEFKISENDFSYKDSDDFDFVNSVYEEWDSILSEHYYDFKRFNSTKKFKNITQLVKYVKEHNLNVVGDLS